MPCSSGPLRPPCHWFFKSTGTWLSGCLGIAVPAHCGSLLRVILRRDRVKPLLWAGGPTGPQLDCRERLV